MKLIYAVMQARIGSCTIILKGRMRYTERIVLPVIGFSSALACNAQLPVSNRKRRARCCKMRGPEVSGMTYRPTRPTTAARISVIHAVHLQPRYESTTKPPTMGPLFAHQHHMWSNKTVYSHYRTGETPGSKSSNRVRSIDGLPQVC